MTEREVLEERLLELSALYKEEWAAACELEGADPNTFALEFSEGNVHAITSAETMKEMRQLRTALDSGMIKG